MTASTWHLPIRNTIEAAWEKIHGVKKIFWKALALSLIIMAGVELVSTLLHGLLQGILPNERSVLLVILQILVFLFQMGLIYMGILRAKDAPLSWRSLFKSFQGFTPIHLISLYLMQVCIALIPVAILLVGSICYQNENASIHWLGLFIFIVGVISIYLLFLRMMMSAALVLEQDQTPWEAIKQSFYLTRGNVLRLIVLNIIQYLILIISALTVIGLIWGLPFCFIYYGFIYKQLKENRGLPPTSVTL